MPILQKNTDKIWSEIMTVEKSVFGEFCWYGLCVFISFIERRYLQNVTKCRVVVHVEQRSGIDRTPGLSETLNILAFLD